ncbi:MAG: D-hexose-6-phosphate mutarotase [Pseudomonadota bacterium]
MQIDTLSAQYAIPGQLQFDTGRGGFPVAVIQNAHATAMVSLYAGQVLSWHPLTQAHEVLFLSEKAYYQTGKAIKGGVPICWPWFGPDPLGKGRPAHGCARISDWDVLQTAALEDGATRLLLGLTPQAEARALCGGDMTAQLEITVGSSLHLALTTHNHGAAAVDLSQALHTYFAVGDIAQVVVHGLEDLTYVDKVAAGSQRVQSGPLTVTAEVDRIYTGVDRALTLHDAAYGRSIRIEATGSTSAVVWNPWHETAAAMADLDATDYRRMLCVETANAGPDTIRLAGGASHTLTASYSVTTP